MIVDFCGKMCIIKGIVNYVAMLTNSVCFLKVVVLGLLTHRVKCGQRKFFEKSTYQDILKSLLANVNHIILTHFPYDLLLLYE